MCSYNPHVTKLLNEIWSLSPSEVVGQCPAAVSPTGSAPLTSSPLATRVTPSLAHWSPEQASCRAWVLESSSFCNTPPQTWWLKETEIFSFIGLEARSLKSRCWQSWFLPQRFWGASIIPCFSPSSWYLPAVPGIPESAAGITLQLLSLLSHGLLMLMLVVGSKAHPNWA